MCLCNCRIPTSFTALKVQSHNHTHCLHAKVTTTDHPEQSLLFGNRDVYVKNPSRSDSSRQRPRCCRSKQPESHAGCQSDEAARNYKSVESLSHELNECWLAQDTTKYCAQQNDAIVLPSHWNFSPDSQTRSPDRASAGWHIPVDQDS
jgi:hypothetical protein